MTRPAGTTPLGFPYPGSSGIHANTPGAIQALAEAVSNRLTAGAGAVTLDYWAGAVNVSANNINVPLSTFPRLQAVNGMVATVGTNWGGTHYWAWTAVPSTTQVTLVPTQPGAAAINGSVTINLLAWGPQR